MNWKRYKDYFEKHKEANEDYFVLGIDLGNATSGIAYFDMLRGVAEGLDISGGYGKPNPPTALQYIAASREWIFGEYAILNANGSDALLTGFVEKLGAGAYVDIGMGSKSVTELVAIYLKELVANCRNINPKAKVAGIAMCVPDFISSDARTALEAAIARAGYERVLIELVEERKAMLSFCLHNGVLGAATESSTDGPSVEGSSHGGNKLLWLDFGARGLRGGLYEIESDGLGRLDYGRVKCLAAALGEDLGTAIIDDGIYQLLLQHYCRKQKIDLEKLSKAEIEQLLTFSYGHKDILLNQEDGKDVRLYYNFVYPPFSEVVKPQQIRALVKPWENKLDEFLDNLLAKLVSSKEAYKELRVICTGGGFEMPWARKKIAAVFGESVQFYKNSKGILAAGATLYAAGALSLLSTASIKIEDSHKLPWDVGIYVKHEGKGRFYTLLERGSWLWQKPKTTYLIVDGDKPEIELALRDQYGKTSTLGTASLGGLPKRPPGTAKIALNIEAKSMGSYAVKIKDLGFGEIYPAGGYSEQYVFERSSL
jgi:molecular chaperone DnaK (HSP70)